jgi:hypothetical protein
MGGQVAELGQVDFVRLQDIAQSLLDGQRYMHAVPLVRVGEIRHFPDMRAPDYAAIAHIVRIRDQHDAAAVVTP